MEEQEEEQEEEERALPEEIKCRHEPYHFHFLTTKPIIIGMDFLQRLLRAGLVDVAPLDPGRWRL